MTFLEISNISKTFGNVAAVNDVSLDIAQGEFVTFLGPSGSGKSTTLYMIAGFFEPSGGDVRLGGRSILAEPSNKRNIGMVFQRYTLFPHLSVAENVAFPLRVRRRSAAEIGRKVEEMLALVRLEGFADRMPAQLSGGQQQRVALARALAYDPPLLLMDEPLSALDKKLREEIQDEIRRIHRQTGVTILYVTHDQEEALSLSDRIALFNHGRIEQLGKGRELYEAPRTRFVADFVGHSNFLDCTITRSEGESADIVLPDGGMLSGISLHGAAVAGARAGLMIRPDRLRLSPLGQAAEPGIDAVLSDATFIGETYHFVLATGWGASVNVRMPASRVRPDEVTMGAHMQLHWEATDARLFCH
ncbi:putative spermidine/putrescine transport system ATP-binding protein [Ancylobacter aquaticus]|uniref:Putative spermidine/putrescine transport system ATP-binding protein n=1 Tax=Ancylobacter aquaticus TaxID=100 RepID=A0A4R1I311_ANCAQ|nr:ABC transporter ATP-binding protein [Ancylobacter aquaticus]TCK28361.1 putative spermidine/putrescine transport system ATP-binding protein [Ancylobacter aquaticus]